MQTLVWVDCVLTTVAMLAALFLSFNNVHFWRKFLLGVYAASLAAMAYALGRYGDLFFANVWAICYDLGLKLSLATLTIVHAFVLYHKIREAAPLGAHAHLMPPSTARVAQARAVAGHVSEHGRSILARSA